MNVPALPASAVVLGMLCGFSAFAQQSTGDSKAIQFDAARRIWLMSTRESSYALGVDANGALQHIYWGAPLWRIDDLPSAIPRRDISSFDPRQMLENEEYPGWGGPRYYEPALKIAMADGNRDLALIYVSHRIEGNQLYLELADVRNAQMQVTLHYQVYPEYGILRRSASIHNRTKASLTIESAQSAAFYLPAGDGYHLTYLTGRWAAETQVHREAIQEGQKILESRKGHTSHNFNPWFSIDRGEASEENGSVWFGALAWSGNWRIAIEQTPYRQVRVTGGLNNFDFAYPLKPGESLETPYFYAGSTLR